MEVGKAKNGFYWDLTSSFFRQFASLFISIILARLLSPEEFGIVGMAMVFVTITDVFIDVGFTSGLIQNKHNTDVTYSSVFYLNVAISLFSSTVIFLGAPYVGSFFDQPEIGTILRYLAFIPFISALGRIQSTILTRNMNFRTLSIRTVISTVVAGVMGVSAALYGLEVYSLVVQQFILVITSTVLLWSTTTWRPKLVFSWGDISSLFSYSGFVFIDQVFRQVFNKIDTIFIGKAFSPEILGFYSRAESLKAQIDTYTTGSLRKVMFPALSALQNDERKFHSIFYRASEISTGMIVLVVAPFFFLAEHIIIFLLGEDWRPSVIFFQILLLSTLSSPHIGIMAQAVLAKGYSKLKFQIGLVQRLLKLSPIVFGLLYGIIEFTIAITVSSTIVFIFYAYVVDIRLNIRFLNQLKNWLFPTLIFGVFIALFFLLDPNPWLWTFLFLFVYMVLLKMSNHSCLFFIQNTINSIVEKFVKRR
ncbi:lipopolysaccharide biosynthesis protein [Cyclobacterium sp. SYSU L10401]|uniref:lipopolysaccharide biosynthesis protein n=1 Tax=Cyclobacterium sp. SYSU L10401 TaxID=2678657 RepID=UPI0013D3E022|nr:lipopolysaccharide biosynthesis protein [Cyclobacterium sp. SYSU L10401]